MELIEELKEYLAQATRIVFLGGAGVSTESGIPDFRSAQGLYQKKACLKPEEILSHSFFKKEPAAFLIFIEPICFIRRHNRIWYIGHWRVGNKKGKCKQL